MMTLDEAIKHCEEVAEQKELESGFDTDNERYTMTDNERADCKECAREHQQLAEWLTDYKRLKEQEPCEDCISRAEAIKGLGEQPLVWIDSNSEIQQLLDWREHKEMLERLPSVGQKVGHWIDGHCSECGCDVPAYVIDWKWQKDMDANYCPNCGSYNGGKV